MAYSKPIVCAQMVYGALVIDKVNYELSIGNGVLLERAEKFYLPRWRVESGWMMLYGSDNRDHTSMKEV